MSRGEKMSRSTTDLMQTATSEDYRIYVHGRWDYEDDFKSPPLADVSLLAHRSPFNGHFSVCPYHNETDQEYSQEIP